MFAETETAPAPATLPVEEYLQPLRRFYEQARLAFPRVEPLPADALPLPQRHLLAHQRDMTPTLESFHGGDIYIEVLRRERRQEIYAREVLLRLERNQRVVEFGANRVHLANFPSEARWMIQQEKLPLGRILKDHGLPHQTRPLVFFRVEADRFMAQALGANPGEWLYGRQAAITRPDTQPLSEVVEILPPVHAPTAIEM